MSRAASSTGPPSASILLDAAAFVEARRKFAPTDEERRQWDQRESIWTVPSSYRDEGVWKRIAQIGLHIGDEALDHLSLSEFRHLCAHAGDVASTVRRKSDSRRSSNASSMVHQVLQSGTSPVTSCPRRTSSPFLKSGTAAADAATSTTDLLTLAVTTSASSSAGVSTNPPALPQLLQHQQTAEGGASQQPPPAPPPLELASPHSRARGSVILERRVSDPLEATPLRTYETFTRTRILSPNGHSPGTSDQEEGSGDRGFSPLSPAFVGSAAVAALSSTAAPAPGRTSAATRRVFHPSSSSSASSSGAEDEDEVVDDHDMDRVASGTAQSPTSRRRNGGTSSRTKITRYGKRQRQMRDIGGAGGSRRGSVEGTGSASSAESRTGSRRKRQRGSARAGDVDGAAVQAGDRDRGGRGGSEQGEKKLLSPKSNLLRGRRYSAAQGGSSPTRNNYLPATSAPVGGYTELEFFPAVGGTSAATSSSCSSSSSTSAVPLGAPTLPPVAASDDTVTVYLDLPQQHPPVAADDTQHAPGVAEASPTRRRLQLDSAGRPSFTGTPLTPIISKETDGAPQERPVDGASRTSDDRPGVAPRSERKDDPTFLPPPPWVDWEKVRRGQKLWLDRLPAWAIGLGPALLVGFCIGRFAEVLYHMGYAQSAATALKRYQDTGWAMVDWFRFDLRDVDSPARIGIATVRSMHAFTRKRIGLVRDGVIGGAAAVPAEGNGGCSAHHIKCPRRSNPFGESGASSEKNGKDPVGAGQSHLLPKSFTPLSQYDLAQVLLAFSGIILLIMFTEAKLPKVSEEDLDAMVHTMRLIGYYLGIRDDCNICSSLETLETATAEFVAWAPHLWLTQRACSFELRRTAMEGFAGRAGLGNAFYHATLWHSLSSELFGVREVLERMHEEDSRVVDESGKKLSLWDITFSHPKAVYRWKTAGENVVQPITTKKTEVSVNLLLPSSTSSSSETEATTKASSSSDADNTTKQDTSIAPAPLPLHQPSTAKPKPHPSALYVGPLLEAISNQKETTSHFFYIVDKHYGRIQAERWWNYILGSDFDLAVTKFSTLLMDWVFWEWFPATTSRVLCFLLQGRARVYCGSDVVVDGEVVQAGSNSSSSGSGIRSKKTLGRLALASAGVSLGGIGSFLLLHRSGALASYGDSIGVTASISRKMDLAWEWSSSAVTSFKKWPALNLPARA